MATSELSTEGGGYTEFSEFYKQTTGNDHEDRDFHNLERPDFPRAINNNIDTFQYYTADNFNDTIKPSTAQLSVINFNIRGINCNFDNLLTYLNSLECKFDIIILTESHIQNNAVHAENLHNKYPIEGYDMFYVESSIKFGGVIMYVKSKFKATYFHELTKTTNTHDSLYVKIDPGSSKGQKSRKQLYIGGYYRHCLSKSDDIVKFLHVFDNDLSHRLINKNDVIIAGDFNICLMKSTYNTDSLCFLNTIIGNNYEPLIFKPTRIQYFKDSLQVKSATLIDQIITNLFPYECISGNLHYPSSDHHATFSIFSKFFNTLTTDNVINDKYYRRYIHTIDQTELFSDFNNCDWDELIYNEHNLDTATDNLTNKLQELCDKFAPLTEMSNRKKKYCQKPYIDKELLSDIKTKNRLYEISRTCPSETNKMAFNVMRNKVSSKLRAKKKAYFHNYFLKFRHNSKKVWDGINLALQQTRHKKTLPMTVKDVDGTLLEDDQKIANAFAKYFQQVPDTTKSKIKPGKHPYLNYLNKCKPIDNYLSLEDTNVQEVLSHIMKLKNSSSPGPVQIPNEFLKLLAEPLAAPLTCLINRSMCIGYVPCSMKIGKQTPVHKSGDSSVQNYRPITVCSSISKILEKVVRDRVMKYLERHKILNNSQFGFRSKHSTNHAVINLTETTLDALESNMQVGGVFLDIAKAFDCVNHDILLRKLEYYGFRGATLMWFESYLKDRLQYVNIRRQKSNLYKPKYGVPQGGTLAPVLFIIFMNDIVKSSDTFDFSMYADDTCLILGIEKNKYDETMKNELIKIVDWFSSNELLLNIKKTDYLHFGPHYKNCYIKGEYDLSELHIVAPTYFFILDEAEHNDPDHIEVNKKGEYVLQELHKVCPDYFFNEFIEMPDGSFVFEPPNVKYLGVYLDNNLTFKRHIDILCCKLNRMVGIFWKSSHLSIDTKKIVYHSLVESHLNYGILMWGSNFSRNIIGAYENDHVPENLKVLNTTLNKVVRAIFRKPRYDKKNKEHTASNPLYKELGVLKLSDLYYYNLAMIVHEYFYGNNLPEKLSVNYTRKSEVTNFRTRNNEYELYYNTPRLVSTFKKPTISSAAFWNTLPNYIKSLYSKYRFKKQLKQYLIDKY